MYDNDNMLEAMQRLGCQFDVTDNFINKCEATVYTIYGYPIEVKVNQIHPKCSEIRLSRNLLCSDMLIQYIKRAYYQLCYGRLVIFVQLIWFHLQTNMVCRFMPVSLIWAKKKPNIE